MYAQARYYLPEVGRFISEDSFPGTLPDSQSQNRYIYCKGNPLRYVDPDGHETMKLYSGLLEVAKGNISFSDLHYDYRNLCNGVIPTYEECVAYGSGWELQSLAKSRYHDNGIGKSELKFVHKNGREAVFDGDTHEIVYDSRYRATYNFGDYGNDAQHFFFDMFPYYIGGNNRGEFTWNPLIWFDRTGIADIVSEIYTKYNDAFWNPIKKGATKYSNYLYNPN